MTGISQQFCVRWNSHLGSLGAAFPQLLAGQQFVDVTLACDGHQVHCHRLVLAACSSYFESLLSENPCKHPIIILPKDIKLWEIHALVDFMYKGQVNVSQAGLPQLLKCAETLQIRGLCGTDSTLNEVANGKIDRCLDPNLLAANNNCSSSNFSSFSSMFASSNLLNATTYHSADDEQQQQPPQAQQPPPPSSLLQHTFRPLHSDLSRIPNATAAKFVSTAAAAASAAADNNTAKSINHRSNESLVKTKAHKIVIHNDNSTKEHCNASTISTTKHSLKRLNENEINSCNNTGSNELNIKCEEIDSDANVIDDGMDDDLDEHSNSKQSDLTRNCNGENEMAASPVAMIQVNDGQMTANVIDVDDESNAHEHITPDIFALDVNESISITKREPTTIDDTNTICYSPSWSMHIESDDRQQQQQQRREADDIIECDTLLSSSSPPALPTSLKFNRNTMSISVKRTAIKKADRLKRRLLQAPPFNESIICSPQFEHMDDLVDPNDSDANGGHFGQLNENYFNSYHNNAIDDIDNGECDADDDVGDVNGGGSSSALKMARNQRQSSKRLMELLRSKDQLRSAVVLRSPRGNQPRTYTTDALYSALMDVKSGESIYRASQIHGVPRKTLRNWMKRWHIKSVYPMPYQLKKAAEMKRQIVRNQNEAQTSSSTARIDLSESETNEY